MGAVQGQPTGSGVGAPDTTGAVQDKKARRSLSTLYVSTFAPTLGTGRALRTYTCVRALAMLGPVELAYVAYDAEEPCPEYQAIDGLTFHRIDSSRGARRMAVYLSKLLQGTPSVYCRGTSPELIETAERLARAPNRGAVVVGDMSAASALLPLARKRPIVYNAHNIESDYVRGHAAVRPFARSSIRRFERRLLTRASESWMVSRADIRSARQLVPQADLRYVPNVVDVASIEPCLRERPADPARPRRLLMVGDFKYPPNRSGLEFLVGSVLQHVWSSAPTTELTVVGRGLDEWAAPDPRITCTGFVEDLAPLYADADCVVVPLIEGAGTPLKFIEALAYGVPVVATPMAAKGLDVIPGQHYREGSEAEQFAQAILGVLRDGGQEQAAEGRRLAEREYSVEALAELLAG